jgi:hypothetical protein
VVAKRRYALHMKDNSPTIEGLLVKRGRREYTLIAAEILQDADTTHPLPGHVEVPRENVYCLQRVD